MSKYRICSKGTGKYKRYKAQKQARILGGIIKLWFNLEQLIEISYVDDLPNTYKTYFKTTEIPEKLIEEDLKIDKEYCEKQRNFKDQKIKCEGIYCEE